MLKYIQYIESNLATLKEKALSPGYTEEDLAICHKVYRALINLVLADAKFLSVVNRYTNRGEEDLVMFDRTSHFAGLSEYMSEGKEQPDYFQNIVKKLTTLFSIVQAGLAQKAYDSLSIIDEAIPIDRELSEKTFYESAVMFLDLANNLYNSFGEPVSEISLATYMCLKYITLAEAENQGIQGLEEIDRKGVSASALRSKINADRLNKCVPSALQIQSNVSSKQSLSDTTLKGWLNELKTAIQSITPLTPCKQTCEFGG